MGNTGMKILGIFLLLLGIGGTVMEFCLHDILCKYDMNPLCFFWALKWAFLGFMCWVGCSMSDDE